MSVPLGIKAVGFDLGETLMHYEGVPLNWQSLYPQALTTLWNALSCDRSLTEDDLTRAGAILAQYNTRLNPRTVEVPATQILAEVLACWDFEANVEQAEEAFFGFFQQHYVVYEDTLPALNQLRENGLKIGVLTDVPYGMSRRFVERDLALIVTYLDIALTSVEVGHRKPSAQGFFALATALGVPPDQIIYVGNEPKDIEGAKAAGMYAVLLVREPSREAVLDYGQDTTITSLREIGSLVRTI